MSVAVPAAAAGEPRVTVVTGAAGGIGSAICRRLAAGEMADWIRHDAPAMRRFGESTPAGRIGSPDEIAGTVAFLAPGEASYLQGSVVMVDGGVTA